MSNFATAMNMTHTWNGAISYAYADPSGQCNGRISLFFKAIRQLNIPSLYEYLREAANEDLVDTFLLTFNIRDCRGGKGERNLGRKALTWLFLNHPDEFMKVADLIVTYGRYDDLIYLWPKVLNLTDYKNINNINKNYCCHITSPEQLFHIETLQWSLVDIMGKQLLLDKKLMLQGKPVSLCAKWAPTEKDKLDREFGVVRMLCGKMNISKKIYRTVFISPLRKYIDIVERYMCNKEWSEIDFNKVPSCAMLRLKKAFEQNTPDTFLDWKVKLDKGEAKVNAKQLFPHEIIVKLKHGTDTVLEAQWKVLEEEAKKLGTLSDTLCVVDTSGSMTTWGFHDKETKKPNFTPHDVATALGLLISNTVQGMFHNHVITFHTYPAFKVLEKGTLYQRFQQIRSIPWGGSTNIQATFELILNKAKNAKLSQEDMPKRIIIISDMQFNIAEGYSNNKTNFQRIDEKYQESGYTRPILVFWNVNGNTNDFPVTVDKNNTVMVSGYSTSIIKAILNEKSFTSYNIMRAALDDERYAPVKQQLTKD